MFLLEQDEQIVKVVRRHWFVMLPIFLVTFILAAAPTILYYLLSADFVPSTQNFLAKENLVQIKSFIEEWRSFAYSIWLLLLWIFLFIEWTNYYLDFWVISNKRIIDVEQRSFFHRDVTSFNYSQIQDITVETRGLLETFFKFGTLHIQTAGHNREIVIKDASHPEEARSLILRLQEQAIKNL